MASREIMQSLSEKINAQEWSEILQLFDQMSGLSEEQKKELIEQQNYSTEASAVLSQMLEVQSQKSILDESIDVLAQELVEPGVLKTSEIPEDILGQQFGAWQIVSKLAQGGMGQVYLAKRSDGQYEKEVALKLIKSGKYTEQTKQKFQQEMQVLARLEHPNIARMIDGGVNQEGILYIVLELVEGMAMDAYANSHKLTMNQRLKLMLQVCDAVAFAHQNLVVHGDIKPENILVNQTGQVKLVDFGISRSLLHQSDSIYLAQYTPGYASPEQKQGQDLTTASDVFSVTAVLLTMCGFLPEEGLISKTKWLQGVEANKDKLNEMGLHVKGLKKFLNLELGSVILKGMSVKVRARYSGVGGLKNDLKSVLKNEAVNTYSVSKWYVIRKNAAKYMWTYLTAFIGIVGVLGFATYAIKQADVARSEAQKATWTSDFLKGIFDEADPVKNQQNPITVNELTGLAADRLLLEDLQYAPEVKLSSLLLLGNIQFKLGQAESAALIHQKYIDLLHKHINDNDRLANGYFELGMDFTQLGRFELALKNFKAASQIMPLDEKLSHIGITSVVSVVLTELRLNNIKSAGQALARLKAIEGQIMDVDQPYLTMQNVLFSESRYEYQMENYPVALGAIKKALSLIDKSASDEIIEAEYLVMLAEIYDKLNQYDDSIKVGGKALEIFITNYGDDHPETLVALTNHASNLGNSGRHSESIEMYQKLINVIKDVDVPDYYQPVMLNNMAHQYRKNGQFEQAIEYFKQAVPLWQSMNQPNLMGVAMTNGGIARSYLKLENHEESSTYFDKALSTIEQLQGKESGLYAKFMLMKIPVLIQQNKDEELSQVFPQTERVLLGKYGEQSDLLAKLYLEWAHFLSKQGDMEAARQKAQISYDTYLKQQDPEEFTDALNSAKLFLNQKNYSDE